jgi:hypothetical protein
MKNAEQWCFSIRKTNERLLTRCFSNGKKMKGLLVFQQREKLLRAVLQQRKGKNETGARRSCFGSENDGEEAGWDIFVNGKKWKVLNRGVQRRENSHQCSSAVLQHRRIESALYSGVSAS